MNHKLSLLGYAYGGSSQMSESKLGPEVLRHRGLVDRLSALGYEVRDLGNVSPSNDAEEIAAIKREASAEELSCNNFTAAASCCKNLYAKTTLALAQDSMPLIIGGEHSLSVGSVSALSSFYQARDREIGLLWIDTHADLNTPSTSPSGNIFGMSVAFLLGLIPGYLRTLHPKPPAIRPENLAYIGLRNLDEGEKLHLKALGLKAFTIKEIDRFGLSSVIDQALETTCCNTAGIAASFDLDVCDPQLVPGTGTPCRGGLSFRESHLLMELLYDSDALKLLEVVELNPRLDRGFETADLAVSLIESACGKSIL